LNQKTQSPIPLPDGTALPTSEALEFPWYIIIEGAIGVGKTTLARMLQSHYGTGLQLEVFEENPFLAAFYREREQYAFQTQMFFLLSRYRQQQQVPQLLNQGALISDYMFAKDQLFAELNLGGDEWDVYQQMHKALAEQISPADLIVYLQADTEVLMGRIAQRDRPYERDMDSAYIEAVRQTYEHHFQQERSIPVLFVDTNSLNFVAKPTDFQSIVDRISSILQSGTFQQPLPKLEIPGTGKVPPRRGKHLADLQRFHTELDRTKGFNTNLYFNYLCLSEELGELGSELAKLWKAQDLLVTQGKTAEQAHVQALQQQRDDLESELADCLAYLLKLANYAEIDLESAYLKKMTWNTTREWT
jgi:deoxyadenosine/deoxycytidine kinase/NTP pyrophosphatase (non-canonical NTP hydrolase)